MGMFEKGAETFYDDFRLIDLETGHSPYAKGRISISLGGEVVVFLFVC
jgi:hypothetical protein